MRTLLVLGAIVIALMAMGVIHFQKNGDQVNITIDKSKLKKASAKVIAEGEEFAEEATERFRSSRSDDRESQFESDFKDQAQRYLPRSR